MSSPWSNHGMAAMLVAALETSEAARAACVAARAADLAATSAGKTDWRVGSGMPITISLVFSTIALESSAISPAVLLEPLAISDRRARSDCEGKKTVPLAAPVAVAVDTATLAAASAV